MPRVVSTVTARLQSDLLTGGPGAMQFVNSHVGYVLRPAVNDQVGGGVLERTEDSGRSWQDVFLRTGLDYVGLRFFSPDDGILTATTPACDLVQSGCEGVVLSTEDGGRTFHTVLRVKNTTFGVSAAWSPTSGWLTASTVCFSSGCNTDSLYATSDGGRTWSKIWSGKATTPIGVLSTADGQSGYAVAGGHILRTLDGGRSFQALGALQSHFGSPIYAAGGSLQQLPDGTLYVSACDGAAAGNGGCENYLYRSTDGGASFHTIWSQYCTDSTDVHMQTAQSGVLILMGSPACQDPTQSTNVVLSTTNGFRTTRVAYTFRGVSLRSVQFTSDQVGWAVGAGLFCGDGVACPPVVYRTDDGGYHWKMTSESIQPNGTLAGVPGGGYYAIGTPLDPTAVLASSNGRTWRIVGHLPLQASPYVSLGSLQMVSRSTGYVLMGGSAWRMTNGGRKFTPITMRNGHSVIALSFLTPRYGYLETQVGPDCPEGEQCRDALWVTRDGGQTYSPVDQGLHGLHLGSIAFVSQEVGYGVAICPLGKKCGPEVDLYQTIDGGATWGHISTRLGLTGIGPIDSAPGGYAVVVSTEGFAVLVPGIGWKVVRFELRGAPPGYQLSLTGPTGIALGLARALVLMPGVRPLFAPYDATSSHAP
ncbi:MAG: hypothetical protein M0Z66_05970 [Thermaerobacter sp.]|nr:hypothetical protein [Thermaerobacter sp.]